jgi:hypothetical protein
LCRLPRLVYKSYERLGRLLQIHKYKYALPHSVVPNESRYSDRTRAWLTHRAWVPPSPSRRSLNGSTPQRFLTKQGPVGSCPPAAWSRRVGLVFIDRLCEKSYSCTHVGRMNYTLAMFQNLTSMYDRMGGEKQHAKGVQNTNIVCRASIKTLSQTRQETTKKEIPCCRSHHVGVSNASSLFPHFSFSRVVDDATSQVHIPRLMSPVRICLGTPNNHEFLACPKPAISNITNSRATSALYIHGM